MGAAPSSVATRPIDTASSPSASATPPAAATIRGRLRVGFGPLSGRSRTPQAAATLSGSAAVVLSLAPVALVPSRGGAVSAAPEPVNVPSPRLRLTTSYYCV